LDLSVTLDASPGFLYSPSLPGEGWEREDGVSYRGPLTPSSPSALSLKEREFLCLSHTKEKARYCVANALSEIADSFAV
jgi:hypothetical protein